jgi:hypothetical protein
VAGPTLLRAMWISLSASEIIYNLGRQQSVKSQGLGGGAPNCSGVTLPFRSAVMLRKSRSTLFVDIRSFSALSSEPYMRHNFDMIIIPLAGFAFTSDGL